MTRIFLIAGATKGIGRATSERLAAAGHTVVGIARRADASFSGMLVSIDLDDRAATDRALAELVAQHAFDGVVNNVGRVRLHPVGNIDLADLEGIFRTNIHPTVPTMSALLPCMKGPVCQRLQPRRARLA